MQDWGEVEVRELGDSSCVRYERVQNPTPSPPLGEWRWDDPEQGFRIDMTIDSNGMVNVNDRDINSGTLAFKATWTLDEDNYYLEFANRSATWTPTGGSPEPSEAEGYPRVAYAPTDDPDKVVISYLYEEEPGGDNYLQYGYYRLFERP